MESRILSEARDVWVLLFKLKSTESLIHFPRAKRRNLKYVRSVSPTSKLDF